LVFNRAADIIRIADQARFPSTVRLDHLFNPAVQPVVQQHMGEAR
jgi:hypothetical protein